MSILPDDSFPNQIKLSRKKNNWTQEALAKAIGVTQSSINKAENGVLVSEGLAEKLVSVLPDLRLDEYYEWKKAKQLELFMARHNGPMSLNSTTVELSRTLLRDRGQYRLALMANARKDSDEPMGGFWKALLCGRLTIGELPEELYLSNIEKDMERLRQVSIYDSLLRGACIVYSAQRGLILDHEVTGSSDTITPMHRITDTLFRHDHLGFFQTLPKYEGWESFGGFSPDDFAAMIEDGDRIAVMLSGNEILALVRTDRCNRLSGPVSDEDMVHFVQTFTENFELPEQTPAQAVRQANYTLCRELGLAFYAGKFGHPLRKELPL